MEKFMLLAIILPVVTAVLIISGARKIKNAIESLALTGSALNIILTIALYKANAIFEKSWAGFGMDFSLRLYHFSAFIMLAVAAFAILITIYSIVFLRGKEFAGTFYALLLLSVGLANGAVLADNLVLMLFFWEALLVTLFAMILIGNKDAFKTATKALIIVGVSDICMMAGIAIIYYLSGTFAISKISLTINGIGGVAFILMVIGAIAKAGSMPFHSWIPDAAKDAPLPFMALVPAAMEKLLGIYLLARISLDMFRLTGESWASYTLMIVGAITIIAAVSMALIQKDYKRLLSYHAISQVGYMILGIGTLLPAGIVGGLFHMINHALYKSGLFLTGGAVERQTGTTDLVKLGGLYKFMPVTFICFLITAASISGVPPFNGFFSKELVYEAALKRGSIFYIAAIVGSFLTAVSFLKLGHAAYMGKAKNGNVTKEAPIAMIIPMVTIASFCIFFGIWNAIPIGNLIQPILGLRLEGHNFAEFHINTFLLTMTIVVLIAALLNHLYGFKRYGSGDKAADHIHYAPVLNKIYENAERGNLDPYNIGLKIMDSFSLFLNTCDRSINWFYDKFVPGVVNIFSKIVQDMHNGNYSSYIVWSIAASAIIILVLLK